jgi:hypothetical protein
MAHITNEPSKVLVLGTNFGRARLPVRLLAMYGHLR